MSKLKIKDLNQLLDNGLEVYRYYISPNVPLRRKILSPLRAESDPSFSLYPHRDTGIIFFTDHGSGEWGNHYTFVMKLFNVDFITAVEKIKAEVLKIRPGLDYNYVPPPTYNPIRQKKQDSKVYIMPEPRAWSEQDEAFWGRFRIPLQKLEEYYVYPLEYYTVCKGDRSYTIHHSSRSPIYAIEFPSGRYKIYRPMEKKYKWISNTVGDEDVFGERQLTKGKDKLFVLAGNKDVLSFSSVFGYNVIAFNSESANVPEDHALFSLYIDSNTKVYVLYDNDETGRKNTEKMCSKFNWSPLTHILEPHGVKDFADLIEKLSDQELEEFKLFFDQLI